MPGLLKVVLSVLVLAAGVYDLRIRKIPNWLNLSGVVLGFGLNVFYAHAAGLSLAAFGLLLAMVVYVPLYLIRGMGAGDVKLMAAVGALAGPQNWLAIFLVTALLGGACSLFLIFLKHRGRQTILNVGFIVHELLHARMPSHARPQLDIRNSDALRLPHGTVIAAGSLAYLLVATH